MSAIALLCLVALVAVVIVGIVGAVSSGTASLDEVYARHEARRSADGGTSLPDPWVTDARTVPEQRVPAELVAEQVVAPGDRRAV